jgi:hypothetical protein
MICDLEPKWFFGPIITLPTHMIQSYVNDSKFIIASKGEEIYIYIATIWCSIKFQ